MYNPNAIVSENTYLLLDWTMYKEQFFEKKNELFSKAETDVFPKEMQKNRINQKDLIF